MKLLFLTLVLVLPTLALGQPNKRDLSGEIALEAEEEQKSPYARSQDDAIAQYQKLASQAKAGGPFDNVTLSQNSLNYLSAVYLFCITKQGICPAILNGILEADIVNGKLTGSTDCPLMKGFWKYWVKNDMDQRQKYMTSTGFISVQTEFQRGELPKYKRCGETVAKALEKSGSAQEFLAARYKGKKTFSDMVALLSGVRQKIPNVFTAVDVTLPATE